MSAPGSLPTARVQRVLPAPPAQAYDAWLDEAALATFICPAPGSAATVSVDPRIGGRLRVVMAFEDRSVEISGEYLALDRPDRLSFTWRNSTRDEAESIVTVTFAAHGEDQTLMTISHSMPAAEFVPDYESGWTSIAEQLEARLS
jgi:uncharacterized protein YndB with AHSA1/START domain